MKETYAVFPHAGAGRDVAACRVPVNVGDTVMVGSGHELEVSGEILFGFNSIPFIVEVPEIKIEALLRVYCGHDNEATFGGPIDGIAVLFFNSADVLEVAHSSAFDFFRTKE